MTDILSFRGGINWRLPAYGLPKDQCVYLQNLRVSDEFVSSMPGTIRFHNASLGSDPVTAIIPHYGDDDVSREVLVASGDSIYKRDEAANSMTALKTNLVPNRIVSSASRHGVTYIASDEDMLMKYLGGQKIEQVGGGDTRPGPYQIILYMKEIDRMFGIRHKSVKGQIGWSDLSDPENWDPVNVDRIKLQDGEITETGEFLYGKLIIFNTYSIWIYYVSGNPENWRLEQAPTTVGIRAIKTLKRVGNELWFLGDSPRTGVGIYAFNGSTARLLTDDIQPLMDRINTENIEDCAAEYHNGFYTLSFPLDFATQNSHSIDLDTKNLKEDGTPAIYGPHTVYFNCSAVLNTRQYGGQHLLGDPSDGFVYREGGISFKSGNSGVDGQLMQSRFLSGIYNDGSWDVMKRYERFGIHFVPRGFFNVRFNAYFSYSSYAREHQFQPDASVHHTTGDFNVFEERILGGPQLAQHIRHGGLDARGCSIQFELLNDVIHPFSFQGVFYDKTDIYKTRKAQIYAA